MQRYDTYKDSGVKWLGEIPEHWEVKRLASYFTERRVKVSDKEYEPLSVTKLGVFPQWENVAKTNDGDNRKLVKKGDFVINSRSDRKGSSGVSDRDGSVSLINIVLQPRKTILAQYSNYLLKSYRFIEEYYRNGRGIVADLWTTRYDEMKMIKLAIPPLNEQEAIAAYLDTATAKIDAAIAQQQKMIDLLNERKQIIINNAVTHGLNPNVKMKDSGVEWIGEVPEGWEVRKLKFLLRQITAPSLSLNKIGLENIESGTGEFIKTNSEYEGNGIQFEKGDILYGKLRPYLKKVFVAEESGNAVGDFFVFRPNDKVEVQYMQLVLLSQTLTDEINSSTYGAKMPRVSIDFMGGLNIPLPSLDEQKEIVETIHKNCKPIDDAISIANNQISLLQERKQIIINEVVTGKVKVV